jgi:hypothetical protein
MTVIRCMPHRKLFTVSDTFIIRRRGVVVMPGLVPVGEERFRVGDPLLLKRPNGSEIRTVIGGIEMFTPPNPNLGFPILLKDLANEDVPVGTEVWSVDVG